MLKSQSSKTSESGFTLIEIMIVVIIVGVLAAIAVPGFRAWKMNSDANADMRRLYGFFQRARLEAVKQNTNSVLTFNQVDQNGNNFDFFLFIDLDGNGEFNFAVDGPAIVSGNMTPNVTMTANNFTVNGDGLQAAIYNSRGLVLRDDGAQFLGATITLQSGAGVAHSLIFNRHGRMRIQ